MIGDRIGGTIYHFGYAFAGQKKKSKFICKKKKNQNIQKEEVKTRAVYITKIVFCLFVFFCFFENLVCISVDTPKMHSTIPVYTFLFFLFLLYFVSFV